MSRNLSSLSRQKIGLLGGIPLFFVILLMPMSSLSPAAHRTLAVAILMAWWWITEAIPIPATALIPILAFPILKILPLKQVVPSYGDSNIFLFMGGFFLAMAIRKWNLHRRIALHIIRIVGSGPNKIILGFMLATAFLSMWISNTATTMMMFPIGLAVIVQMKTFLSDSENPDKKQIDGFQIALMLGIAYAASIGGIGTKIGTPPNIVFAGAVRTLFPGAPEISFLQWLGIGLPLVLIFLPITWLLLTRVLQPVAFPEIEDSSNIITKELQKLGPMQSAEKMVTIIFVLTALGWIFRKNIDLGAFTIPGWSDLLGVENYVNDATVAIAAAILLFLIPVDLTKRVFLLDWEWAVKIPWGILLLFGGGIALANGFKCSGLAEWVGGRIGLFSHLPLLIMIMLTCFLLTFLTELTSNTATAAIFMPILAITAISMNIHPYLLMVPATISASCAFMLPVATPPNAIIFGSGCVTIPQMAKNGVVLNFVGIIIVTIIVYLVAIPAFGIFLDQAPVWIH